MEITIKPTRTLAIYCGSFNPLHIGHLNIVEKAEKVFGNGNVILAIGVNPDKISSSDYSAQLKSKGKEHEVRMLSKRINREVVTYSSFLHELVEKYENYFKLKQEDVNIVIIRGLRNGDDLDYEVNQFRFIKDFKKDINVVYFTCDQEYEHISSSAIRKIRLISDNDDLVKGYLV